MSPAISPMASLLTPPMSSSSAGPLVSYVYVPQTGKYHSVILQSFPRASTSNTPTIAPPPIMQRNVATPTTLPMMTPTSNLAFNMNMNLMNNLMKLNASIISQPTTTATTTSSTIAANNDIKYNNNIENMKVKHQQITATAANLLMNPKKIMVDNNLTNNLTNKRIMRYSDNNNNNNSNNIINDNHNKNVNMTNNNNSRNTNNSTNIKKMVAQKKIYCCRAESTCQKTFRDASTRTRHEKVHSPSRFPCKVCGAEYSRKDNRNRHQQRCVSSSPRINKRCYRRKGLIANNAVMKSTSPSSPSIQRKRAIMKNGVLTVLADSQDEDSATEGMEDLSLGSSTPGSRSSATPIRQRNSF